MVGLDGAGRFASEIERFVASAAAADAALDPDAVGTAQAALTTLSSYLNDVISGQPDTPAPLFPLFDRLARANGAESAGMSELFFPALEALPPAYPEPVTVAAAELGALVTAQRSRFQRALLRWLRGETAATEDMSAALLEVERIQGEPHQRVFWWIAGGLVDCVKSDQEAPPAELKKLFSRIDRQFARLAGGEPHVAEQLLRDMLYWISQARSDLPRPLEIQRHYNLLQAGSQAQDAQAATQTLERVRADVDAAHAAWVSYVKSGRDLPTITDRLRALPEVVAPLQHDALSSLSSALAKAAGRLPERVGADPELTNEIGVALEVASSLLASLGTPAQRLLDLAGATSRQLTRQLAQARPNIVMPAATESVITVDQSPGPICLLDEQGNALPESLLTETLAREMTANLNRAEDLLEQFFRNETNQGVLSEVERLMAQIHGGLQLAEMTQAVELLARCRQLVGCLKAAGRAAPEEVETLAEALSSLGSLLRAAETGEVPAAAITAMHEQARKVQEVPTVESQLALDVQRTQSLLQSWEEAPEVSEARTELQAVLENLREDAQLVADSELEEHASKTLVMLAASEGQPSPELVEAVMTMGLHQQTPLSAAPTTPAVAPTDDESLDREMLEVFLAEAREVVADGRGHLVASRAAPSDLAALREIRRGFHTLKGSSRMVGLKSYGEVAWTAEQAMNRWLERGPDASERLLSFVARAYDSFGTWADAIAAGGQPAIDPQTLVEEAAALEAPEPATEDLPAEPAVAISAEPENIPPVAIVSPSQTQAVSRTLRDIYLTESAQLLNTLSSEIEAWGKNRSNAPASALVRAAHTMAGISRTTSQPATAALAYALEQWALQLTEHPHDPGEAALDLMRRTQHRLSELVAAFRDNAHAGEDGGLIAEIEAFGNAQTTSGATAATESPTLLATASLGGGDERRRIVDDIDLDLLPVFLEEAETLVPVVGNSLREWRVQPKDSNAVQALQRALHTFKGSARMVGALRLGELIHRIESEVNEGAPGDGLTDEVYEQVQAKVDRVNDAVERLRAGDYSALALEQTLTLRMSPAIEGDATLRLLTALEKQGTQRLAVSQRLTAETTHLTQAVSATNSQPIAADQAAALQEQRGEPTVGEPGQPRALIRVAADSVDVMVNQAGEVNIARSRVESEMRFLRNSFNDLTQNIVRLRQQLREIEIQAEGQLQSRQQQALSEDSTFDPLEFDRFTRLQELTRMMAESVNDIGVVQQSVLKNLDEAEGALRSQARTSFDLQQQLMRVRMVPFANVADRFYRVVRVTARELGKRAQLELHGAKVELDRGVLERITAPLEHLLRNALAHGIEPVAQRENVGKVPEGRIQLELEQQGNDVVITLTDDGNGMNVEDIQRAAIARGLLSPDHNLSRRQLIELIFTPGFSTAAEVTEVAGRGVGLDVVKSEITALGGRVEVSSELGKGTRFAIYLPLTLAIAEALLVRVGSRKYALPSAIVQQVQRFTPEALAVIQSIRELSWAGEGYRFSYMPELFGQRDAVPEPRRFSHVLLLRSGGQRLAVQVDELIGIRQVVVKGIGPQLATVSGLVGATVLADGEIVLIVNPVTLGQAVALTEVEDNSTRVRGLGAGAGVKVSAARTTPTIMVVDDSITVRKISERTLSREGYQVVQAKDGLDALEKLRDVVPDVMLVDIEMPRMDGFDLTRSVRADSQLRHIPIIMITSRTAEKHRSHALQLGVNVYLGKPYTEEDLLSHIRTMLAAAKSAPQPVSEDRLRAVVHT
jgi:chemosensory pili system protein ChpA (sensor histidine kinase/response regulator)